MDLDKPMPFFAKVVMTTDLEYKGHVTLQELIDGDYLEDTEAGDEEAVLGALRQYSKNLGGEKFVKRKGSSGSWTMDDAGFIDK
ncbi:hypothetical protein [Enterovibrio norvegicus]|uniref:hypothetical protein n=1 Tax=Enterovibrio norvegicus TaxID=188144 RepID=UPI00352D97B4